MVMADEFMCGEGQKLQRLLEDQAIASPNWLAERWLKSAYLQYRDPVTIYSSPGMTLPLTTFCDEEAYLRHCGKLIMGLVKYKAMIDCDKIPVAKMGQYILDNSQFKKVLGTCRIPVDKEDSMQYNPDSKHVVVIHQEHVRTTNNHSLFNFQLMNSQLFTCICVLSVL